MPATTKPKAKTTTKAKTTRPTTPAKVAKAATTKTAKKTPETTKAPARAGSAGIRIRMYRVGFGDFFLLTLTGANGDQHILIDCGVYRGTSGQGDLHSIEAAVGNLAEVTQGKLALVVMTHRHADHIAGFGRCADVFRGFKVGSVWMPIWETEYDEDSKTSPEKFQADLTALAKTAQAHLDLALAAGKVCDAETYHRFGNATGVEPLAKAGNGGGSGTNAVALDLLKNGLGVEPQYLKAGDKPMLTADLKAAGLGVVVLGPPPVDDIAFLQLMDLQKHVGEYLAIVESAGAVKDGRPAWQAFSAAWSTPQSGYPSDAFREWMPDHGATGAHGAHAGKTAASKLVAAASQRLEKALQQQNPLALDIAAKKLDSFLNNQSLVLLFTFHGKNLLFVGDAQGGNWESWLYESTNPDKAPAGPLARRAQEILDSVDVYKVGHHGSTNATPIVVSKGLRQGSLALCSTQEGVYGQSEATAVPLAELMAAIDARGPLVRSDQLDIEIDGKATPRSIDRPLPGTTDGTLAPGDLWIDYVL